MSLFADPKALDSSKFAFAISRWPGMSTFVDLNLYEKNWKVTFCLDLVIFNASHFVIVGLLLRSTTLECQSTSCTLQAKAFAGQIKPAA